MPFEPTHRRNTDAVSIISRCHGRQPVDRAVGPVCATSGLSPWLMLQESTTSDGPLPEKASFELLLNKAAAMKVHSMC